MSTWQPIDLASPQLPNILAGVASGLSKEALDSPVRDVSLLFDPRDSSLVVELRTPLRVYQLAAEDALEILRRLDNAQLAFARADFHRGRGRRKTVAELEYDRLLAAGSGVVFPMTETDARICLEQAAQMIRLAPDRSKPLIAQGDVVLSVCSDEPLVAVVTIVDVNRVFHAYLLASGWHPRGVGADRWTLPPRHTRPFGFYTVTPAGAQA